MSTVWVIIAIVVGLLVLVIVLPRVIMALRTAKLKGKPAPNAYKPSAKRIKSGAPTILYFHTPTCRACLTQDPIIRKVQHRHPDAIFKVNAKTHRDVASAYGVLGVPFLAFIEGGRVISAKAGVQQESAIMEFLAKDRRRRG